MKTIDYNDFLNMIRKGLPFSIIKLDNKYEFAYVQRGLAKSELEQYEEAIKDFDKAIELNNEYVYIL